MKKVLLPAESENIHHYRANLHSHSTLSDGKKTPEEMKEFYKSHGYSVLAITDHNVFVPHNDLTDDDFLMLNGYEVNVGGKNRVTCHICLVACDKDNDIDRFYHRTEYIPDWYGKGIDVRKLIKFDESKPDYIREYTPECISDIMKTARDNGFFVTYNHPYWSMETYEQYINYDGMDAMEIYNYGCVSSCGYDEDNSICYEDFLRKGKRIFCVATDDNHNHCDDNSVYCDSFGGSIMIVAENLKYNTVTKALKDGNFYSLTGTSTHTSPKIKSISVEDGKIYVETEDARSIYCLFYNRAYAIKIANDGETVNSAEFAIGKEAVYFRIVVTDTVGYKTYSNAYFIDEIMSE